MKHTITFDVAETLEMLLEGVLRKMPELKEKKVSVELQLGTEWRGGQMDGEEVAIVKGSIIAIQG